LVTLTIASGPSGASLGGSTSVTVVNGIATFSSLSLTMVGTYTLQASSTGLTADTSSSFTITVGAVSAFAVGGFASPTTAGTAGPFRVAGVDVFGNVVPGYPGTVHFPSSDGRAVLPADYTFIGSDIGSHGFSATLKTAGFQVLTASDGTASGSQGI